MPIASTANATPKLAPELIPRIKGSASGLRNMVCICKPATESAAPVSTAVSALVSRKFSTMVVQLSLRAGFPTSIPKTCLIGMETEPRLRLSTNAAAKINTNSAINQPFVVGLLGVRLGSGRASITGSV